MKIRYALALAALLPILAACKADDGSTNTTAAPPNRQQPRPRPPNRLPHRRRAAKAPRRLPLKARRLRPKQLRPRRPRPPPH